MKQNAPIMLILLVGFTFLLAACKLIAPGHQPALVEQNPPSMVQVESPLPPAAPSLNAIDTYQSTLRREESDTQTQGTEIFIGEIRYTRVHADNQHGYNAHSVTTLQAILPAAIVEPDAVTEGVMDEQYLMDDIAFIYCGTCPDSAEQGGWSAYKRGAVSQVEPRSIALGAIDTIQSLYGSSIEMLVAQSNVAGSEKINGIDTIHYQFTDVETLREIMPADPQLPMEIQTAQVDIWLTVSDRLLIQYVFQATGRKAMSAGASLLEPFTLEERYSVTEINSQMTLTVPTEILTAVAPQINILNGQ